MTRFRCILIVTGSVVVITGTFLIKCFLAEDAFKTAFNLKKIPPNTLRWKETSRTFTDETIAAYLESSQEDITQIISARSYRNLDNNLLPESKIEEMYPVPIEKFFPSISSFQVGQVFRYEFPSSHAGFCMLWIDSTFKKAFILYSVD